MKVKLLKVALSWLVLALVLPVLALFFTAGPVEGCPCETETVTVSVDVVTSGGDVEVGGYMPSDYPVTRSGEVGDRVSLEAVPADGYYFVGWSGDLTGSENPTEVRLSSDVEIIAHFFPEEFVSEDEMLHVVIPEGTIALDKDGELLSGLELGVSETPLSPPDEADIIGLCYELGPQGASFDQPVAINCSYDPGEILPRVAEEELLMVYYDEDTGQWQELSSTVDTVNHIVTTLVDHLSTFAVIAPIPPPLPAAFTSSSLAISPLEADIGETVIISVLVTNTGELEGSYRLTLEINGVIEATREITLAGGSQRVGFPISGNEAGAYAVAVNGLEGSFTVREAPFFPIALPAAVSWVLVGPALAALLFSAVILPVVSIRRNFY
jgi:hypothetical protein